MFELWSQNQNFWDLNFWTKFSILHHCAFHFAGSLESPMAASSSSEAYHPSSTYFHQECQWFFDPPPARQLILKISTAHKMSEYKSFVNLNHGFFKNQKSSEAFDVPITILHSQCKLSSPSTLLPFLLLIRFSKENEFIF